MIRTCFALSAISPLALACLSSASHASQPLQLIATDGTQIEVSYRVKSETSGSNGGCSYAEVERITAKSVTPPLRDLKVIQGQYENRNGKLTCSGGTCTIAYSNSYDLKFTLTCSGPGYRGYGNQMPRVGFMVNDQRLFDSYQPNPDRSQFGLNFQY